MSDSSGMSRHPIDIEEFERRLRASDNFDEHQDDPLSALARLVDGHRDEEEKPEPEAVPVQHAPAPEHVEEFHASHFDAREMPLNAASDFAHEAPDVATPAPVDDWETDLQNWENELRGLAGDKVVEPAARPAPSMPNIAAATVFAAAAPAVVAKARAAENELFDDYSQPSRVDLEHARADASDEQVPVEAYHQDTGDHAGHDSHDADAYPRAWRHDEIEPPTNQDTFAPEAAPAPARARKPLIWLGSGLLGLAVVSAGAIGLRGVASGPKEPPTILAKSEPAKVQPEVAVANTAAAPINSVFDKTSDKIASSRVVSNQEQPVDIKAQAAATATVTSPVDQKPAVNNGFFPEPKRVKTVSVRPDGSIIEGEATPAARPSVAPPPPPPKPTLSAFPLTPVAATPKPATSAPKTTTRAVAAPKTGAADHEADTATASTPSVRPKPATPAPAAKPVKVATAETKPASGGGGYAVQFAAAGSDAEGRDRVARVQSQYGSALEGHKPSVVRGEANGAAVYRVRVGGLSKDGAVAMCTRVKASGGSCFVAGN